MVYRESNESWNLYVAQTCGIATPMLLSECEAGECGHDDKAECIWDAEHLAESEGLCVHMQYPDVCGQCDDERHA